MCVKIHVSWLIFLGSHLYAHPPTLLSLKFRLLPTFLQIRSAPYSTRLRPAPPSIHNLFIKQVDLKALHRAGNASNSKPASMTPTVSLLQWQATHIVSQLPNGFQFFPRDSRPIRSLKVDFLYWIARAWDTRGQFYTAVPSQAAMRLGRYLISRSGRRWIWILAIHMRTVICMGIGIGKWEYDSHADMAF